MRRTKRKNGTGLIIFLLALTLMVGSIANRVRVEGSHERQKGFTQQSTWELVEVNAADMADTRELILVNGENRVAGEPDEFAVVSAFQTVPVARESMEMQLCTLAALSAWLEAAEEEGHEGLYVTSGYRDYAYQKTLYDEAADKSFVQPPGASEHHTGLAVDMALMDVPLKKLDSRPEGKWLIQTAKDFGFIMRYPSDKVSLTKISYEPWHFRYVGLPHSVLITDNGLCMEEYIELLQQGKEYSIDIGKIRYTVYYTTPQNGLIRIPAADYSISGCNTDKGGYIVTVTEDII